MGNCMTNTDDAINQEDEHSHHANTSTHPYETNNTYNHEHNEDNNKIKTIMDIDIDVNVFKDNKTVNKCGKHNDNPIEACDAVKRLVLALKYYSTLDLITNTEDQNTFAHFITNIYKI
eukprot:342630_1